MKKLLLLLIVLVSCTTAPTEIREYRANVYVESYSTVQQNTIAEVVVVESDIPTAKTIWVEFQPFLKEAFSLEHRARNRFGITMFKVDTLYVANSIGAEFQNLY